MSSVLITGSCWLEAFAYIAEQVLKSNIMWEGDGWKEADKHIIFYIFIVSTGKKSFQYLD